LAFGDYVRSTRITEAPWSRLAKDLTYPRTYERGGPELPSRLLSPSPWKARGLLVAAGVVAWGLALLGGSAPAENESLSLATWLAAGAVVGAVVGLLSVIYARRVWLPRPPGREPTSSQKRGQTTTLAAAGAGIAALIGLGSAEAVAACLAALGTFSITLGAGMPSAAFEFRKL